MTKGQKLKTKPWDQETAESLWKSYYNSLRSSEKEEAVKDKSKFITDKLSHIKLVRYSEQYNLEFEQCKVNLVGSNLISREKANELLNKFYHDATYWLTVAPTRSLVGLDTYLFKNINKEITELEIVAARWSILSSEDKLLPHSELLKLCRSMVYVGAKDANFAAESAHWAITEEAYKTYESGFIASQSVKSPFDSDRKWSSSNLTAQFLKRNDPRGLYLGQHTNCCQHPSGVGSGCAWYGQESPNSGFLVINNGKNEIIAQSWAWVSDNGGLCFDNCEAKGLGNNQAEALELYQSVANDLNKTYHTVTIGSTGDLDVQTLTDASSNILSIPSDYSGYRDSRNQKLLAYNPNLPKIKFTQEKVYVRGGSESDLDKITEIVRECFGSEGGFVPEGNSGLVLEDAEHGSIGYAILDTINYTINDIAVLPQHRGRNSLKLINEVIKKCKTMCDTWDCQARESTSYKLLKHYEKKGMIQILEEEDKGQRIDKEKYTYIKFKILDSERY